MSIREHWGSAEEFYVQRDHRTQLEIESLHKYVHTPIEIHVSEEWATSPTIQQIALTAANLTSRWARRITVFVPHVRLYGSLDFMGDQWLETRIAREMKDADPFGDFDVKGSTAESGEGIRLFIGCSKHFRVSGNDYCVSADKWLALGRRGLQFDAGNVPAAIGPAAALAGALGAADLFKRAIGHSESAWLKDLIWCTWSHELLNDPEDCQGPMLPASTYIGEVLVAGVGAIGSALIYVLGLIGASGDLTVLDRDSVETSNLNRSPLFTALHAATSPRKVDVAFESLQQLGIGAKRIHGTWREKGDEIARYPFDVWVSLTNEDGAWAEVPYQLPPTVIHGTTTSGWGIAFGRHIPGIEDCTACRLPRPHAEFRGPCSEGAVSEGIGLEPTRASLPFLSTIPAALLAAELLKLNYPQISGTPNSVQADFRFGVPSLISLHLGRSRTCGACQIWNNNLWSVRGGRSRLASLSQASPPRSIGSRIG